MKLTTETLRVLEAIRTLSRRNGYCPSYKEIQAETRLYSPNTVWYHVDRLIKAGLLARRFKGSARSLTLAYPAMQGDWRVSFWQVRS